mgnify:CR=1 FL=1
MTHQPVLGIIGGSGLYSFKGLENIETLELTTPFGKPSSPIVLGSLAGKPVAFIARHGIGHWISPTEVNYRANIYAFKQLGVSRIVSISACGSLRDDYSPGHIVIPDQIVDFTNRRQRSFFGEGVVVHISPGNPFCPDLSNQLLSAVKETRAMVHKGGTLITIEGPRFSTRGESNLFRSWGMSIIGMTAAPEAFLAREAEICYTTMAHVTDYDVWHMTEEPVSVDLVVRTLQHNTEIAQETVLNLVENLTRVSECNCDHALQNAIITQPEVITSATREKLGLLLNKYIGS